MAEWSRTYELKISIWMASCQLIQLINSSRLFIQPQYSKIVMKSRRIKCSHCICYLNPISEQGLSSLNAAKSLRLPLLIYDSITYTNSEFKYVQTFYFPKCTGPSFITFTVEKIERQVYKFKYRFCQDTRLFTEMGLFSFSCMFKTLIKRGIRR